jgi:hypothetical protein
MEMKKVLVVERKLILCVGYVLAKVPEAQRVYSDASPFPRQQIEIQIAHYISITSKKQVRS